MIASASQTGNKILCRKTVTDCVFLRIFVHFCQRVCWVCRLVAAERTPAKSNDVVRVKESGESANEIQQISGLRVKLLYNLLKV